MTYITSYINPDIDGIACGVSLKEYLDKQEQPSEVLYTGNIGMETQFIIDNLGQLPIINDSGVYPEEIKFILVDIADPQNINPAIDPNKVVQIFDHHLRNFPEKFPHAKITIDKVGSCATLITEYFQSQNHIPSRISATLLYSAIISNTINFKNTVTTDRDKQAAAWLNTFITIPDNFIKNMFRSKSQIDATNLKSAILQDFAIKTVGGKQIGIAQIEVVDLDNLITNLKPQLLEIFSNLKSENKLDYFLFTGIDVWAGFNRLLTIDDQSSKFFSQVLSIPNIDEGTKTDQIIMRKQIWPLVENILAQ